MMAIRVSAPWHKASYDKFLSESLPAILADRLPLVAYQVAAGPESTCCIRITVSGPRGQAEAELSGIPSATQEGVFHVGDRSVVVVPTASREELDAAEIRCVGEQLLEFIEPRLGDPPTEFAWDEKSLRSWLPLDRWVDEFFQGRQRPWAEPPGTVQALNERNWLSRCEHLRVLLIPDREKVVAPGQLGRVCPIMTPEGKNIGRVLFVAAGAEIRDGRLIVVDNSPQATLSVSASVIPLLEHNDAARSLMGANMMRQWIVPRDPEPALVQTGDEPAVPEFWCGRNLLTAFVSLGADTFEDAIVISESAAARFDAPHALEPGDKMSNRHGAKSTISRIVPDDDMPHLADGTPVEIVFDFLGCHTRLNFGQIREAILGRIARAEGRPAIVPAFHGPNDAEVRERLRSAGLPESGMEALTLGRAGKALARPSTVGWVYWGRTEHLVADKIHASTDPAGRCNLQAQLEYYVMRDAGAFENIAETYNTRAAGRLDADGLADRVASGEVVQAEAPSPGFVELTRRLSAAGIETTFDGDRLQFAFASPAGRTLPLARSQPHPWAPDHALAEIGAQESFSAYAEVVGANDHLRRTLAGSAPESLVRKVEAQLAAALNRLFDDLLGPADEYHDSPLRFGQRNLFSGRSVISPGGDLRIDQLGVADEIAWAFFGPLAAGQVGREAVADRTEVAAAALDAIMAESWVLLNRAPSVLPTSVLAFHPVRIADRVLRVHPAACRPLNGDFDGDQCAVFLPITAAGQREAGQKLSLAAHVRREPDLIRWMLPSMDALWGLAELSRTPAGLKEICDLATVPVAAPEGFVTQASLEQAARELLGRDGADKTLEAIERLMRRGLAVARESGASISPFIGETIDRSGMPEDGDALVWEQYAARITERIAGPRDFDDPDLGPQLLAVMSGARGYLDSHLVALAATRGTESDLEGRAVRRRRGYREGVTPEELFACAADCRRGMGQIHGETVRRAYGVGESRRSGAFTVLARAMRSQHPGIVFAQAAATGEVDPLTDLDTRLFVGLPAS